MGIKKNDFFSFIIASALNIGLIYLIPTFTTEDVGDKKIKVGLVALEKEKTFSKENNKDLPNKKKSEKKQTQNTTVENIVENTEEVKKEKSLNLVELSKGIQAPSFEIISSKKDKSIKRNSQLENVAMAYKKEMKYEREESVGLEKEKSIFSDAKIIDKIISDVQDENLTINSNKDMTFENIKVDKGKVEGLPSGYKLGLEDGDVIARWDSSNREPEYPEKAELRGLQGTVKVRLDVNERGEVLNLTIIKGSGVPEINKAIENIGRTWKIYLSKHGLRIKGRVILDYTFKLKGI
ncbi:MAG: energy transducer TonB [Fusobacterium perfoetens]|uniref:energy transducer TonB n=1 Tax=Fusobacterium perfoetens TaxID=852 RepID=UPI0023F01D06|nr:energy transducer TonB [Fusobacterium perfoetens]MCI6152399.1 energy transducer TonB [Fusobacterium perfoetens]MDY3236998.1 energy transducer TonB [Fusobacterium perfoetens]